METANYGRNRKEIDKVSYCRCGDGCDPRDRKASATLLSEREMQVLVNYRTSSDQADSVVAAITAHMTTPLPSARTVQERFPDRVWWAPAVARRVDMLPAAQQRQRPRQAAELADHLL